MDEMEVLKWLNDDQKNNKQLFEKLFESEGWKLLHQFLTHNVEQALLRKLNAQNWDTNRVAHGEHLAYSELANIQNALEAQFRTIAENARDAARLESEGADDFGLE